MPEAHERRIPNHGIDWRWIEPKEVPMDGEDAARMVAIGHMVEGGDVDVDGDDLNRAVIGCQIAVDRREEGPIAEAGLQDS